LHRLVIFIHQVCPHAQGVDKLKPHLALLVQGALDIGFQRFKTTGLPEVRLAMLSAHRQARGKREYLGRGTQQGGGVITHEAHHLCQFGFTLQYVGLVDDDDYFLSPVTDLRHKAALRFRERPVYRCQEQHQVCTRHEMRGQLFVLTVDGIRTGGIHDADLCKQFHRQQDHLVILFHQGLLSLLPKAQDVDLRCGGGDAFL